MKHRFFRHRLGGDDPDAERVYLWHIAARRKANRAQGVGMDANKAGDEVYLPQAQALLASMVATGFDPAHPVPIDPGGELLDGAHRVACALAIGIEEIVVRHEHYYAWAPAWDEAWFVREGMAGEDLERLRQDWAALTA